MKVVINKGQAGIRIREGEKDGRKWKMVSQLQYWFLPGQAYPEEINVTLPDGVQPYPDGEYELELENAISKDRYGAPSIDSRKLALIRAK